MDTRTTGRKRPENGRKVWIDGLKGFAALTVVLGHVVSGYLEAGQFEAQKGFLTAVFNGIYAFHMPLFFVISGFVFSLAYLDGEGTPKKDRIRIQLGNVAAVYVGWSLLLGGLKILFTRNVSNVVLPSDLLWIPLKAIGLYWYLYVLFLCYLMAAFLVGKHTIRRCYVACAAALVACLCKNLLSPFLPGYTVFLLLDYGFFFLLGVLLQRDPRALAGIGKPVGFLSFGVAGIGMAVFFLAGEDGARNWGSIDFWGAIMALSLSLSVLGLARWCDGKGVAGALAPIGRYSLEIFLLQTFVIAANRTFLPMVGITDFAVSLCTSFVTAVAVPILLSILTKKLRVHDLLFCPATWLARRKGRVTSSGV